MTLCSTWNAIIVSECFSIQGSKPFQTENMIKKFKSTLLKINIASERGI